MTLILYVTRGEDGTLRAEIESREQAPGRKAPAVLDARPLAWARITAAGYFRTS